MANKYTALPIPNKSVLEKLYNDDFKSQKEIGELFNTTQKVVFTWFQKLGIKSRIPYKRNQKGSQNDNWRGDEATYAAFHYRVQSARGKADRCECCKRSDNGIAYDWANQTGDYANVEDYKMMCRSCHFKKDEHKKNFPNNYLTPNINIRKVIDGKPY